MPITVTLAPDKTTELTDETVRKMADVTVRTKKAERGFALCYREGKVVPSKEHIGGPNSISYKDCVPLRKAGSFHTHPRPDSRPSWYDGWAALNNSQSNRVHWITCVGCPKDNRIRCVTVKEIPELALVLRLRRRREAHRLSTIYDEPEIMSLLKPVLDLDVATLAPTVIAPPLAKPRPVPPEFAKEPRYQEGELVGFDIAYAGPAYRRRDIILAKIREQHPELEPADLNNAGIVYGDNYAQVKLPVRGAV